MSITSIARNFNGDPNIVTIVSDNTLTEITTAGYLTSDEIQADIELLQNGEFVWQPTDLALIKYEGGIGFFVNDSSTDSFVYPSSSLSPSLPSGQIFVGNASNVATPVAVSGDATLSNTGVLQLANGSVVASKLAPLSVGLTNLIPNSVNYSILTSNVGKSVFMTFTPAQINNMFNVPLLVIPATVGGIIIVDDILLGLEYGGSVYTGGGEIFLQYGNGAPGSVPKASLTMAVTKLTFALESKYFHGLGSQIDLDAPKTASNDTAVYLTNADAVFASGNSPITISVVYRVLTSF